MVNEKEGPFPRVAIVGVGLIGGSIALAARRAWPAIHIIAVDHGPVARDAVTRGAVDEARTTVESLGDADLIVLALPLPQMIKQIPELAQCEFSSIVTDVGSTKRHVMAAAQEAGLRRFVGGHPIAGAAQSGLANARADLFDAAMWALVDPDRVDADSASSETFELVERFVFGLGAKAATVDADAHDRLMAYVSHAPQLVSSALMSAVGDGVGAQGLKWGGTGLMDTTRLASSPPDVWQGIIATNWDYIREALDATGKRLRRLYGPTDDAPVEDLERLFEDANLWRERLLDARRQ